MWIRPRRSLRILRLQCGLRHRAVCQTGTSSGASRGRDLSSRSCCRPVCSIPRRGGVSRAGAVLWCRFCSWCFPVICFFHPRGGASSPPPMMMTGKVQVAGGSPPLSPFRVQIYGIIGHPALPIFGYFAGRNGSAQYTVCGTCPSIRVVPVIFGVMYCCPAGVTG